MNFYVLATIAGLTLLAGLARTIPLSLKMYGSAVVFFPALFLNSVQAQSDYHIQIVRPTVGGFFGQRFLCAKPYSIAECDKQVVILQAALRRYPIEGLGQWTWVLVRSEDWKPILTRVQMDPNSPAFSILERRQTFVEEALLVFKPHRQLELLEKWNIPFDKLLDFAVSHELGHAFCGESDEIKAAQRIVAAIDCGRAREGDSQLKRLPPAHPEGEPYASGLRSLRWVGFIPITHF